MLSVLDQIKFEQDLETLMSTYHINLHDLHTHCEIEGVGADEREELEKLENELEDISNELQRCEEEREQIERNEDYLLCALRKIQQITEKEDVKDWVRVAEIIGELAEIEDIL